MSDQQEENEESGSDNNEVNSYSPICGTPYLPDDSVGSLQLSNQNQQMDLALHLAARLNFLNDSSKPWKCHLCPKRFSHCYVLKRHLTTHSNERKYECEICGKAFRQRSTLCQHKSIHTTDRPFYCDLCPKSFNRASTLICHKKIHKSEKEHICSVCGKGFHQRGNLRNHVFTHTDIRPFRCDICGKGFNQRSNLICHKKKVHNDDHATVLESEVCFDKLQMANQLRIHEMNEHESYPKYHKLSVLIDPIKTKAMDEAIENNKTALALLEREGESPVVVRVLPYGEKHMLIPASPEDFEENASFFSVPSSMVPKDPTSEPIDYVLMTVPVVATLVQQIKGRTTSTDVATPEDEANVSNTLELLSFNDDDDFVHCSSSSLEETQDSSSPHSTIMKTEFPDSPSDYWIDESTMGNWLELEPHGEEFNFPIFCVNQQELEDQANAKPEV